MWKTFDDEEPIKTHRKLVVRQPSFDINSVDENNLTQLMRACADESHYRLIKQLLKDKYINVSLRDNYGNTAIAIASTYLSTINVRVLLTHAHVCINDTNNNSNTALLIYAYCDDGEMCLLCARQLLNHVDIHVRHINDEGITARSLTLHRDRCLSHALITHGRI
jgi:ankyrin repeat protein